MVQIFVTGLQGMFERKYVLGRARAGEKTEKTPGKGQLLDTVPLNSLCGVPAPTYWAYLKREPFRRPSTGAATRQTP